MREIFAGHVGLTDSGVFRFRCFRYEQPTKQGIGVENIGSQMLQKMGWSAGLGLGKVNQGRVVPVEVGRVHLSVPASAFSLSLVPVPLSRGVHGDAGGRADRVCRIVLCWACLPHCASFSW